MTKTLYISDLDGTLLNREGQFSDYTREALRRFDEAGILFTCATGRTLSSVSMLLGEARFTCPAVLSDGLLTFDMEREAIVQASALPQPLIEQVATTLDEHSQDGFLYCIKGSQYALFYTQVRTELSQRFLNSKAPFLGDNIFRINTFTALPEGYLPLYYVLYDKQQTLAGLQQPIHAIPGAHSLLNRDVYCAELDIYFMNILTDTTSKHSAVHDLKMRLGADEVVAFGDNFNDLPMLKSADRCYVPNNGIAEAKAVATEVIEDCWLDSVVRFIEREQGIQI